MTSLIGLVLIQVEQVQSLHCAARMALLPLKVSTEVRVNPRAAWQDTYLGH